MVPEDDTTRCWAGVATLLKKGIDLLFPSQSHTNEIVKNGEYVKWLQHLQPFLQDWEKIFDNAKCMFPMRALVGAIRYRLGSSVKVDAIDTYHRVWICPGIYL